MKEKNIKINSEAARQGVQALGRIAKKTWTIPSPSGRGAAMQKIQSLAKLMKDLCDQTDKFIEATAKMVSEMEKNLSKADVDAAAAIGGGVVAETHSSAVSAMGAAAAAKNQPKGQSKGSGAGSLGEGGAGGSR